jgi:hypothetical protein
MVFWVIEKIMDGELDLFRRYLWLCNDLDTQETNSQTDAIHKQIALNEITPSAHRWTLPSTQIRKV